MCLSTVYVDSGNRQEVAMEDVAQMEAKNEGFLLTGLLGEEKFVQGRIKSVDFVDAHSVVLGKTYP
jgi:predicted RNA-binding protein